MRPKWTPAVLWKQANPYCVQNKVCQSVDERFSERSSVTCSETVSSSGTSTYYYLELQT